MKITDAFLGEHGVFYAQFDEFEKALHDDDLECVRQRAALIGAALEPHAALENELLFDAMEKKAGGVLPPVAVMRDEHARIEGALHAIRATDELGRARELLRDMIETARAHFRKEELVAFPLAEELLDPLALRQLGELWARRRSVRLPVPAG